MCMCMRVCACAWVCMNVHACAVACMYRVASNLEKPGNQGKIVLFG